MTDILTLNCEAFAAIATNDKPRAEKLYRQVLEQDPDNSDALRYLGEIIGQSGRSVEAIPYLKKAVEKDPTLWATWLDLGQALQTTAQTEDAMVEGLAHTMCGTRMAEKEMGDVFSPGHYNTALGLIAMGDWKRGYVEYEHGFRCQKRPLRTLKGDLWRGDPVPGKTIFVYWEGGYGDTMLWTRLLPRLKEQSGAKIVLEVQRALGPLYRGSSGTHDVCDKITVPDLENLEDLPQFDYRISVQSLVHRFGAGIECMETKPYILPRVAPWPIRGPQFKVGLCWKGNPKLDNDVNRSTTEQVMMRDLYDLGEVHYYSFQYGEKPEYAIPLPIKTYLDTAAMIKAMDLLITVDTSVAHLAGAMGKECWLLIPYIAADYRWGIGNERTPLYPSWRLYRQKTPGDYEEVMLRIRDDLEARVQAKVAPKAREMVTV